MNSRILTLATLLLLAGSTGASAGDIYQLNFECEGPAPTLPATITINLYEGDEADPGKLEGTSTETFNGNGDITGYSCDGVMCLTDTRILSNNGNLFITFQTNGFDNGKLKSNTYWEITINGVTTGFTLHTSCSQDLLLNQPFDIGNGTACTLVGGFGDCLPGQPGCPEGDKLYEVNGEYRLDASGCALPTTVTFNVYKKLDELQGTSTATWDGVNLTNIVCDAVACITGAEVLGGELVIYFDSSGSRSGGEFENDTSWEMITNCGGGQTEELHLSCSQVFLMGVPNAAGDGEFTFTSGCGACLSFAPVGTEDASWGEIKAGYR